MTCSLQVRCPVEHLEYGEAPSITALTDGEGRHDDARLASQRRGKFETSKNVYGCCDLEFLTPPSGGLRGQRNDGD